MASVFTEADFTEEAKPRFTEADFQEEAKPRFTEADFSENAQPDLSGVKLSPYQQTVPGRFGESLKPESGMESGTEFTSALATGLPSAIAALPGEAIQAGGKAALGIANLPTDVANRLRGQQPGMPGYVERLEDLPRPSLPRFTGDKYPRLAGVGNVLAQTGEQVLPVFAPPEVGLTLPLLGVNGLVARVGAAAFGYEVLKSLPEEVRQAIATVKDPNASTREKVEAVGKPAVNSILAALMTHGAVGKASVKAPLEDVRARMGQLAPDVIRLRPEGEPVFGAEPLPLPSPIEIAPGGAVAMQLPPRSISEAGSPDMGDVLSGRQEMQRVEPVPKFEETKPVEPEAPPVVTQGAPPAVTSGIRGTISFETLDEPSGEWHKQDKPYVISKSTIPGSLPWRMTVFGGPNDAPVAIGHIELESPTKLPTRTLQDLAEQLGRYTRKYSISDFQISGENYFHKPKEKAPQTAPTEAPPPVVEARPPEPAISEAATVGKGKEGVGKEPWEMTADEFQKRQKSLIKFRRSEDKRTGGSYISETGSGVVGPTFSKMLPEGKIGVVRHEEGHHVWSTVLTEAQRNEVRQMWDSAGPDSALQEEVRGRYAGDTPIVGPEEFFAEQWSWYRTGNRKEVVLNYLFDSLKQSGQHKALVEQALSEGKPVPPEVLADYPDLQPKAPQPSTPPPPIYKSIEGAKVGEPPPVPLAPEGVPSPAAQVNFRNASVRLTKAGLNYIIGEPRDSDMFKSMSKKKLKVVQDYWTAADELEASKHRTPTTPPPAAAKVQSEVAKDVAPAPKDVTEEILSDGSYGPIRSRKPTQQEVSGSGGLLGAIHAWGETASKTAEVASKAPKSNELTKTERKLYDAIEDGSVTTRWSKQLQYGRWENVNKADMGDSMFRKTMTRLLQKGAIKLIEDGKNIRLEKQLEKPTEPTPAPPAATGEGMPPGPGAQTAGTDVPPGAQIEQLSQAFRQITAEKTPFLQKVKEAFDLGKKRELSQNLIARTLSALKTSGDYLIQTWQGQRQLDPILRAKGELSAELETRGWRLRQAMKDMKRAVPSKAVREAISKYVDAGGDAEKLRQSAESVPAGRRAPYIRAMQLTPDEKIIAGHIRSFFDARLQEAMDAGVLSHGVEDYLHRIYPKDTTWRRGVINAVQNALLDTRTPGLAKQRVFQLDAEAERAGHLPVNDFIPRIIDYEASLSKVIASRAAVKRFTEIKMPDGRPMLDVSGIGVPIENAEGIREATLIKPSFRPGEKQLDDSGKPTKNYRLDYQSRDYPALKKWKWATNDAEGKPIFVQGDVLVHPDAVHRVDALLEPSKVKRYAAARAALTVGSVFKQTMLDFSGFHQVQIAIHGLEHKVNPFRLVKDVDTNNPDIQGLLKGGMTLGGQHVGGIYEEGLAGRSLSRQIPGLGELMQSYHDWLFQDFIPRVKTTMAIHALERNKARFAKELASGQMKPEALYHQTAKEANAAFGEQNYIMLERSKTAQDMARLILLAPDFLESRARFALQAGTRLGGEQRMALLLGALTLYTTTRIMNKAINDEWHFEPENMFSVIYNGKSYSVRTVQGDILHLMESPVRFWMHRLNPTITRPLFELMTQRDEFGRKRSFWQVLGDTISNVVPISMRNSREQSIWTSMLNAFGGSVRRDSDVGRVYQEAAKWKAKNGIRTEPGEFIYDSSKDVYRPLKLALLDGNTEGAAKEYQKLIASKAVTPSQAIRHFQSYANAPFSGSKANEQRFVQSLTKDQRRAYEGAKQEKQRVLREFLKARQLVPGSQGTIPSFVPTVQQR